MFSKGARESHWPETLEVWLLVGAVLSSWFHLLGCGCGSLRTEFWALLCLALRPKVLFLVSRLLLHLCPYKIRVNPVILFSELSLCNFCSELPQIV